MDDKTILIYIVMSKDGSGKQYTSDQAVRMVVNYSKVPVYRMVEAGIGDGLLGGNVVSMYKSERSQHRWPWISQMVPTVQRSMW